MMRRLLGGTAITSLAGAAVLGSVLAWSTTTETPAAETEVGWADLELTAHKVKGDLGPKGYSKKVSTLDVENVGSFNLAPGTGPKGMGEVQIISVEKDPDALGDTEGATVCPVEAFENSGTELKLGNQLPVQFQLAPGELFHNVIEVWIGVDSDAPDSCVADEVTWRALLIWEARGSGELVSN